MGIDNIDGLKPTGTETNHPFNPNDPSTMSNEALLKAIAAYDGEIWREDWFISLKIEAAKRKLI